MYGNDSPVPLPALNLNQRTFVLSPCLFPSSWIPLSVSLCIQLLCAVAIFSVVLPCFLCGSTLSVFVLLCVSVSSLFGYCFLFWAIPSMSLLIPPWYWEVGHLLFRLIPPVCLILKWKALMRLGTKLECSQMLNITVKALFSTWYGCSTSADTYTSDPIVTMGGKKSHETFYSCSRSSNIADLELPPQPWHTNKTLLLNNSDCRRILGALAVDGVQ